MTNKEIKEGTEILMDKKEEILATKRLFQIHGIDQTLSSGDILTVEGMIVKNFNYLTENGRISRDEYYALFQKCETAQDFAEIALMTRDFLIERANVYLKQHPELPEEGDVLNPGKGNIRSGIIWYEEGRASIYDRNRHGKKIPIINIGGPSLREIPEWILFIKEQQMSMSEVYKLLEGTEGGAENKPEDPVVKNTVKIVEDEVNGVMDDVE